MFLVMSGLKWQEACVKGGLKHLKKFVVQVLQVLAFSRIVSATCPWRLGLSRYLPYSCTQLAYSLSAQKMSLLQLFLKSSLRTQITSQSLSEEAPSTAHCFFRRVNFGGAWDFEDLSSVSPLRPLTSSPSTERASKDSSRLGSEEGARTDWQYSSSSLRMSVSFTSSWFS